MNQFMNNLRKRRRSQADIARFIILVVIKVFDSIARNENISLKKLIGIEINKDKDMLACQAFMPSYVALVVEYGLKSLLPNPKRKSHDLSCLYRDLEKNVRDKVKDRFDRIQKRNNLKYVDLDKKLEIHRDDYVKYRYFDGNLNGEIKIGRKHWETMYCIICATLEVYAQKYPDN